MGEVGLVRGVVRQLALADDDRCDRAEEHGAVDVVETFTDLVGDPFGFVVHGFLQMSRIEVWTECPASSLTLISYTI